MANRRGGFTIIEVLIGLIILAAMSAVVIPALMGRIRDAQTAALSQTLFSMSQAIFEYRKAVTVYPESLVYLAGKPTATSNDACGADILATNSNNWRGPYVTRELVSGGVSIGDAVVRSKLRRDAGPPVVLYIDVEFVDSLSAMDIDKQFDGSETASSGTVRWWKVAVPGSSPVIPAPPAGMVTLSYGIPITGC